jgi:hypothetical protein
MNPKANYGVLNPPLRGIVQLTNSAALRIGVSTIKKQLKTDNIFDKITVKISSEPQGDANGQIN